MKIETPNVLLRNIFGANPVVILQNYHAVGVAPHIATARVTYQVPVGKRLLITSVVVFIARATVAAPVGVFTVEVDFGIDSSPTEYLIQYSRINTVGTILEHSSSPNMIVYSGETMLIYTTDTSTGGTTDMNVSIGGMLIDY